MSEPRRRMFILAMAIALGVASWSGLAQAEPRGTQRVRLREARSREGLLPGFGISTPLPEDGWKGRIGKWTFLFFDLDADGTLEVDVDGLAIEGIPFVVRLPSKLLVETGQFTIAVEGAPARPELLLTPEDLGIAEGLLTAAADTTEIRVRAGLVPLALDAATSRHCELHCEYLKLNGNERGARPGHEEVAGQPGYTAEGAAAGRSSNLDYGRTDYRSALWGWYATAWHAAPILDPSVRRFGVALKHGVAMFHPLDRVAPTEPYMHPPAGATDVLLAFNVRGERPSPVSNGYGNGCGFPVFVKVAGPLARHRLTEATLTDPRGRSVEGTTSCPLRPATSQWPSNSGAAFFIPTNPLLPNMRYHARFVFEGMPPIEWDFTTGTRECGWGPDAQERRER